MKAKVLKVDTSGFGPKLARLKSNKELGLFSASEAARMMDKYVPYRSGALAGSGLASSEPWKVVYAMPYAIYVWNGRGMTFSKQTHPLARSHWSQPLESDTSQLAKKITMKARTL